MSSQRKGSSGREPLGIRRRACPAVRPLFQPQFVSSPPTRPRLLVSSVTTTSPSALLPSLMASGHLHASQWPLLLSAQAETLARLVVVHPRTVMTDRRLLFKTLVCAQTYVWPRAPLLTEPTQCHPKAWHILHRPAPGPAPFLHTQPDEECPRGPAFPAPDCLYPEVWQSLRPEPRWLQLRRPTNGPQSKVLLIHTACATRPHTTHPRQNPVRIWTFPFASSWP